MGDGEDSWITALQASSTKELTAWDKYVAALYLSIMTVTSIGCAPPTRQRSFFFLLRGPRSLPFFTNRLSPWNLARNNTTKKRRRLAAAHKPF